MKKIWISVLALMIFIGLSKDVFAESFTDVRDQIKTQFDAMKEGLDPVKEQYGVSKEDSFADAVLEKGYPYYVINSSVMTNENISRSRDELLTFSGYIFPIMINSKPSGILITTISNGKLEIFKVSSNNTFENEVASAETISSSKDNKLVYDNELNIHGLATPDNRIISTRESKFLDLKKNEITSISDVSQKIHLQQKQKNASDRNAFGGTGAITDNGGNSVHLIQKYSIYLSVISGITLLILLVIKRNKKNLIKR